MVMFNMRDIHSSKSVTGTPEGTSVGSTGRVIGVVDDTIVEDVVKELWAGQHGLDLRHVVVDVADNHRNDVRRDAVTKADAERHNVPRQIQTSTFDSEHQADNFVRVLAAPNVHHRVRHQLREKRKAHEVRDAPVQYAAEEQRKRVVSAGAVTVPTVGAEGRDFITQREVDQHHDLEEETQTELAQKHERNGVKNRQISNLYQINSHKNAMDFGCTSPKLTAHVMITALQNHTFVMVGILSNTSCGLLAPRMMFPIPLTTVFASQLTAALFAVGG